MATALRGAAPGWCVWRGREREERREMKRGREGEMEQCVKRERGNEGGKERRRERGRDRQTDETTSVMQANGNVLRTPSHACQTQAQDTDRSNELLSELGVSRSHVERQQCNCRVLHVIYKGG